MLWEIKFPVHEFDKNWPENIAIILFKLCKKILWYYISVCEDCMKRIDIKIIGSKKDNVAQTYRESAWWAWGLLNKLGEHGCTIFLYMIFLSNQ